MAVNVYKLLPSIESLTSTVHSFICPLSACQKQLGSVAALNRHLHTCIKQNEPSSINSNDASFVLQYHCPISGCIYSSALGRYFTCLKYLKQHYEKVHAVRNLKCDKCRESFSRPCYLNAHMRHCGEDFKCACGKSYLSREALLTHAKRHQHVLVDGNYPRKRKDATKPLPQESKPAKGSSPVIKFVQPLTAADNVSARNVKTTSKPRLLLPKAAPLSSIPLPTLAALALSELSGVRDSTQADASTQVNFRPSSSHCNVCHNDNMRMPKNVRKPFSHSKFPSLSPKRSANDDYSFDFAEHEHHSSKRPRCSAETQTKDILIGKKLKGPKACAETQTSESQVVKTALLNHYALTSTKLNCSDTQQSIHTQTGSNVASELLENYYPQADFLSNFGLDKMDTLGDQYLDGKQSGSLPGMQNLSPRNQISTYAQTYNLTTNSSGTQTQDVLHRQCSSSQTEKDVFLGHMSNAFSLEKPYLSVQDSHLSEFSHSNAIGSQNSNINSASTTDIAYNALFSPESCGCDKINEIRVYSIETQTELNLDCLFMCDDNEEVESQSDDILYFNIETQTSDDLQGLQYEQLLSNTQTQTTEEYLFPELNFTDIQTQTGNVTNVAQPNQLHELVHIQTQTHAARPNYDFTTIETQTFSQLESCELIDSHTQTAWSCLQELVSGL